MISVSYTHLDVYKRQEWHYTPKPVKGFMARYRKLAASANRGGILVVDD